MGKQTNDEQVRKAAPRRPWGVIVVDPLPVVRRGLVLLLEREDDLDVLVDAGTAEDALGAIARSRRTRVIVLVSLGLDGEHDASWLIREIRERHPAHAVLAVGANADPTSISRALFVGADGFIDKRIDPEEFVAAVREAGQREMVLAGPSAVAVGMIAEGIERRRDIDVLLTPREREVLAVAAEGLTAREMAARLGVRERTVTTNLGRIYGKLGVGSRLAAVRLAARSGLVSVGEPE